jgi:single-stranded-DNA-specific exonuclease
VADVLAMEPFGCGNPAPVFAALGAEIAGPPAPLGDRHLLVNLRQDGRTVRLKAWGFAERAAEFEPGARVDAAFSIESDDYAAARGYPGWCMVLKDVRPAE